MEFGDILYDKRDGVAKITINRPDKGNAVRTQTLIEMIEALDDAKDDKTIGVIVITGAGEKFFCTGGDSEDVIGLKAGYSTGVKKIFDVERLIRSVPKSR